MIGNKIKEARVKLGLTQEYLGNKIGVSRVSMVNIEMGRQSVSSNKILILCSVLNVDANYLLETDSKIDFWFDEAKKYKLKYDNLKRHLSFLI